MSVILIATLAYLSIGFLMASASVIAFRKDVSKNKLLDTIVGFFVITTAWPAILYVSFRY